MGRTGTFIAVYRLLLDYLGDKKAGRLEPYSTVLEMRRQRMKMVQRPAQYCYIFHCLMDEIKDKEGDYYQQ